MTVSEEWPDVNYAVHDCLAQTYRLGQDNPEGDAGATELAAIATELMDFIRAQGDDDGAD
jgi:hypothetical protein